MIQFITIIHIVVCIFLVLVVLLQQGKKDGMGSAFGGGSQSVFGARGAETFLEKLTKALAVIFMCTSLGLVYFSSRESSDSILSGEKNSAAPITTPVTTAAPTADSPATTTVPSETKADDTKPVTEQKTVPAAPAK